MLGLTRSDFLGRQDIGFICLEMFTPLEEKSSWGIMLLPNSGCGKRG